MGNPFEQEQRELEELIRPDMNKEWVDYIIKQAFMNSAFIGSGLMMAGVALKAYAHMLDQGRDFPNKPPEPKTVIGFD